MEKSLLFRKLAIFLFLILSLYIYGFVYYSFPPNPKKGFIPFRIKKGEGVAEISRELQRAKIIKSSGIFTLLSVIVREEHRISAGLYFLNPSMNEIMCLKLIRFKHSLLPYVKFMIPEGYSLREIALLISRELDVPFDSVYSFFKNRKKIKALFEKFNLKPASTLEGYIFPDTYILPSGVTPYEIAMRGMERLMEVLKELGYDTLKGKMDLHEVLTLASIIEKEAVFDFEKPIISSVFYNRLKKGIPLQADPTVKYALGGKRGNLTFEDLQVDSPYNTYKYKGLPPGPICSPGKASIKAVLYPRKTDYLYFVAKGDGTHYFSKSFKEHKRKKFIYKRTWNF